MLSVKKFTFNPVEENTYVLYNAEGLCCIIDPGCYFQQEQDELHHLVVLADEFKHAGNFPG